MVRSTSGASSSSKRSIPTSHHLAQRIGHAVQFSRNAPAEARGSFARFCRAVRRASTRAVFRKGEIAAIPAIQHPEPTAIPGDGRPLRCAHIAQMVTTVTSVSPATLLMSIGSLVMTVVRSANFAWMTAPMCASATLTCALCRMLAAVLA